MATQTVTVSRPPATGNSQSTAIPPASSPVDYSLTDLDLLEVSDAQEGTAEQSDASTTPPEASSEKGTDHPQPAAESKDAKKSPPSEFDAAFALPEVGPKLREICEREAAYREVFPSADSARTAAAAQAQLAGLDRIVESRDPRAHADLLDGLQRNAPDAFRSLAVTFGERLATLDPEAYRAVSTTMAAHALANQRWPEHVALLSRAVEQQDWPAVKFLAATLTTQIQQWRVPPGGTAGAPPPVPIDPRFFAQPQPAPAAQAQPSAAAASQLLEAVNTHVEQSVRQSVGRRVEELLPDAPDGARQKIAGEIFRELDQALRQDPELLDQVRESIHNTLRAHSGAGNLQQREALARLIAGRARAALPGVAKRVVADWTETVLRSSQARRSRQSESASRVEVGRGGAPGPVPVRQRGVDYTRMTDEEILNLD